MRFTQVEWIGRNGWMHAMYAYIYTCVVRVVCQAILCAPTNNRAERCEQRQASVLVSTMHMLAVLVSLAGAASARLAIQRRLSLARLGLAAPAAIKRRLLAITPLVL